MKLVINTCFGGFSLSPRGLYRWAELKGRPCYFFKGGFNEKMKPLTLEEAEKSTSMFIHAYDVPNPEELPSNERDKHYISYYDMDRTDPDLVKVVEELGGDHRKGASGPCAQLSIVEIPDGVDYEIDEYDGNESIHERHRSWR